MSADRGRSLPGRARALLLVGALALSGCVGPTPRETVAAQPVDVSRGRWWKGNTHTHSLWSDGDHYPEMIADWYRRHGYDFVAMTDHNPPPAEKWITVADREPARAALAAYRERFGDEWVIARRIGDTTQVRLRAIDEYRDLVAAPGRFLVIPGEEITQYLGGKAAHMNGINLVEPITPQEGSTLIEILRRDIDALQAQRARVGRPMIAVLNHPNYLWSLTAEELVALPELRFFEVFNAHPLVNNRGDSLHADTERMWDIVLTERTASGGPLLFAVATDDAHDYVEFDPRQRNPGRGWVMVRAVSLSPAAVVVAMERGDFYASTGVVLEELLRGEDRMAIRVRPEAGVSYRIQFIGTRAGYDTTSVPRLDSAGVPVTRRYAADVGAVLAEASGPTASYTLRGDELYVRARVLSSRRRPDATDPDEVEMAWIQPVRGGAARPNERPTP